jgi:hypothetical protein
MATIQLKNVAPDVHAELRRRADLRGTTIRDYVMELIRADQGKPTMEEWLDEVRSLPPIDLGGQSSAELIAEVRAEREADLDQRS